MTAKIRPLAPPRAGRQSNMSGTEVGVKKLAGITDRLENFIGPMMDIRNRLRSIADHLAGESVVDDSLNKMPAPTPRAGAVLPRLQDVSHDFGIVFDQIMSELLRLEDL